MKEETGISLLQKKAQAYLVLKEKVHIVYKTGSWKNGLIKNVSAEFFILDEQMEGTLPVFFVELDSINKFLEKKIR